MDCRGVECSVLKLDQTSPPSPTTRQFIAKFKIWHKTNWLNSYSPIKVIIFGAAELTFREKIQARHNKVKRTKFKYTWTHTILFVSEYLFGRPRYRYRNSNRHVPWTLLAPDMPGAPSVHLLMLPPGEEICRNPYNYIKKPTQVKWKSITGILSIK